jgi:methionine aminopeptidase
MAQLKSEAQIAARTLRTATGARAAHSEHTVAVTRDGVRILTR